MVAKLKKYFAIYKHRRRIKKEGPEHKDMVFELSGKEGGAWDKLKVTEVSFDGKHRSYYIGNSLREDDIIRYYMKVVGFRDLRAPVRDWGLCIRERMKDMIKEKLEPTKQRYIALLRGYLKKKGRRV